MGYRDNNNYSGHRGNRSGGGRFGNGNRFGGDDRGNFSRDRSDRPQLHDAVCDSCGNHCEVPFKPTGDKPVYCRDCFKKISGVSEGRDGNSRRFEERAPRRDTPRTSVYRPGETREFRGEDRRSSYNNDSRDNDNRNFGAQNNREVIEQIQALSSKMDRILSMLESQVTPKAVEAEVPKKVAKKAPAKTDTKTAKKAPAKKKATKKAAKAE